MKTNEDTPILSVTEMCAREPLKIRPKLSYKLTMELFSMDSSLGRYTFYADNCGGSLERTRRTTVDAILVDSHGSVVAM